jgi:hypothetical protein
VAAVSLTFTRHDWTLFRSVGTLGLMAGVPQERIARLVVKELVDNSLDASGRAEFGRCDGGGFYVENPGPGMGLADQKIADLFSIARPLTSTKYFRLPTRGALGNGLRVVSGAVLASRGTLRVMTDGRCLRIHPRDDGGSGAEFEGAWESGGTRVEVCLGPALDNPEVSPFLWARTACELAGRGAGYAGRSSPWWYDSDAFWELLQAAGDSPVRELVARLEGCGRDKAGRIAAEWLRRPARDLSREEADRLLGSARDLSRQVKPERLGLVGPLADYDGYGKAYGVRTDGPWEGRASLLPFVVEAWCRPTVGLSITMCVNRTPVTADVWVARDGDATCRRIYGCNLGGYAFRSGRDKSFDLLVNVQTPFMPITTEGKEPDLGPIEGRIIEAIEQAVRRSHKPRPTGPDGRKRTIKQFIIDTLPVAVREVTEGTQKRFGQRPLFYKFRPHYIAQFKEEPKWSTFCKVLKRYEEDVLGHDLPGICRDNRGVLYVPHTGEQIPLGTLTVEQYRCPRWGFNKILYVEKEGPVAVLRDERWPERHDCALATSKGFATRAVADLLNLLGGRGDPLTILCIHDADGHGTYIFHALAEAARRRSGRQIDVINLGLEPEEALAMGLDPEPVVQKKRGRVRVAPYVEGRWRQWLQNHRVELDAMSTPRFLQWMDAKMEGYAGKVIPPKPVLTQTMDDKLKALIRNRIVEDALRRADVDRQADLLFERLKGVRRGRHRGIAAEVGRALAEVPEQSWEGPLLAMARECLAHLPEPRQGG